MKKIWILPIAILSLILLAQSVQFDFENYWNFDEGSGDFLRDEDNNLDIGLRNITSADWVDGIIGTSVHFNGTNAYGINQSYNNPLGNNFSVQAWVNATALDNNVAVIFGYQEGDNDGFQVRKTSGADTIDFNIQDSGGATVVSSSTTITPNTTWYHIVGTVSTNSTDTNATIYINGVAENSVLDTDTLTPLPTEVNVTVARHPRLDDSTRFWHGRIDEVGIWNRTLSASDISDLYNSGNGLQASGTVVNLNSPGANSTITNIEFNATLTAVGDTNLTNATLTIYDSSGAVFNDTNTNTVTGMDNKRKIHTCYKSDLPTQSQNP